MPLHDRKHLRAPISRLRGHHPRLRESVVQWGPPALYLALLYYRNLARVLFSREQIEVVLIIVLCVSAFTTLNGPCVGGRFRHQGVVCWGSLFLGLMLTSALATAVDVNALADLLYHVVSVCLVFMVFLATARSDTGLAAVCTTLAICAAINASIALWGAVTHGNMFAAGSADVAYAATFGYDATNGRSGGLIGENYSGMYNLPVVVAGLALLQRKKWRLLGGGLVLLGVSGTIVSVSRASILAVVGAVLASVALTARRTKLHRVLGTLIVIFLMSVIGVVGYQVYVSHLPSFFQRQIQQRFSQNAIGNEARPGLWAFYAKEALTRPLFGNGPGYVKHRVEAGKLVPHNAFLDVAVELGLPALVLFVVAVLWPLTTFRPASESGRSSYLYACFTGMLIPLFTLSSAFLPLVWATAGALVGASRHYKNRDILPVGCRLPVYDPMAVRDHRSPTKLIFRV